MLFKAFSSVFGIWHHTFDKVPECWAMVHVNGMSEFVAQYVLDELKGHLHKEQIKDDILVAVATSPPSLELFYANAFESESMLFGKFTEFGKKHQLGFMTQCTDTGFASPFLHDILVDALVACKMDGNLGTTYPRSCRRVRHKMEGMKTANALTVFQKLRAGLSELFDYPRHVTGQKANACRVRHKIRHGDANGIFSHGESNGLVGATFDERDRAETFDFDLFGCHEITVCVRYDESYLHGQRSGLVRG